MRPRPQPQTPLADIELSGVFLGSLGHACVSLGYLVDDDHLVPEVTPDGWYPAWHFNGVLDALARRFKNFDPVKERIGVEMMNLWYVAGPGRTIVHRGVDFLTHQASSAGYRSVVRGPEAALGQFVLEAVDEAAGTALVRSTTPFDRVLERGVLRGGMSLAGDLAFVDIDNAEDPSLFRIEFH